MSLQLERDQRAHLQAHLDELTGRVTLIFAAIVVVTLVVSTQIDAWLDLLLTKIDPCNNDCLNLYDPARWSAVRWLGALLAAIAIVSPLIMQQAWAFSNKGLLPSERTWMLRWMFGGCAVALTASALTLIWLLPTTFGFGHSIQTDMGLMARYDAVLMLSIAIAVIWMQTVVSVAVLALAIAGQLGALNKHTADWWRLRTYGLVLLLLYASLPQFGGLAFVLIVASLLVMEVVCKPWLNQEAPLAVEVITVLDEEGGARRPMVLECHCNGAAIPLPSPIDLSVPRLVYEGLCRSEHQREQVFDAILATKTTDLIVTGCDGVPLGESFKSNCKSLGASVRGMNLLERQSYRTQPAQHPGLEFKLMMAQLSSPWPEQNQIERVVDIMKKHPDRTYVFTTGNEKESWGQQLNPSSVLIHVPIAFEKEFEQRVKNLSISIESI